MTIAAGKRIITPASKTPRAAADAVAYHLGQIADCFVNPKLTLVIRSSAIDGDIIVGNDDFELAMAAIRNASKEFGKTAVIPLPN